MHASFLCVNRSPRIQAGLKYCTSPTSSLGFWKKWRHYAHVLAVHSVRSRQRERARFDKHNTGTRALTQRPRKRFLVCRAGVGGGGRGGRRRRGHGRAICIHTAARMRVNRVHHHSSQSGARIRMNRMQHSNQSATVLFRDTFSGTRTSVQRAFLPLSGLCPPLLGRITGTLQCSSIYTISLCFLPPACPWLLAVPFR